MGPEIYFHIPLKAAFLARFKLKRIVGSRKKPRKRKKGPVVSATSL
jgi:hypothetical protein